jgi:hypothetical protein
MTHEVQGDATYLSLEIPTNKLNLNIDIMKGINRNNLQRYGYILESYVLQGREPCSLYQVYSSKYDIISRTSEHEMIRRGSNFSPTATRAMFFL